MPYLIVGKTYIECSKKDANLVIPAANEFYKSFPDALYCPTKDGAQAIVKLSWEIFNQNQYQGNTTHYGYIPQCIVTIESNLPGQRKITEPKIFTGKWEPYQENQMTHARATPEPFWPIAQVSDYLEGLIASKVCPQCQKESFLEDLRCPFCGRAFTDAEILSAEDRIRRELLERYSHLTKKALPGPLFISIFLSAILLALIGGMLIPNPYLSFPSKPLDIVGLIFLGLLVAFFVFSGWVEVVRVSRVTREIQELVAHKAPAPLDDGPLSRRKKPFSQKISVDRPVGAAWSYLVNQDTWENWYGKKIRMATWAKSELVVYTDGSGSKILAIEAGRTLELETKTGAEAWRLTEIGANQTELLFETTFKPGAEAQIDQSYWEQNVSVMLSKIKSGVEASQETGGTR